MECQRWPSGLALSVRRMRTARSSARLSSEDLIPTWRAGECEGYSWGRMIHQDHQALPHPCSAARHASGRGGAPGPDELARRLSGFFLRERPRRWSMSASGLLKMECSSSRSVIIQFSRRSMTVTLGADTSLSGINFGGLRHVRLCERAPFDNVSPHVTRSLRGSAGDRRTTRHPGYDVSQSIRKRMRKPPAG